MNTDRLLLDWSRERDGGASRSAQSVLVSFWITASVIGILCCYIFSLLIVPTTGIFRVKFLLLSGTNTKGKEAVPVLKAPVAKE